MRSCTKKLLSFLMSLAVLASSMGVVMSVFAAGASETVELSESTQRKAYSDIGNGQPTNAHSPCAARSVRESETAASAARHQSAFERGVRSSARTSANATNQPIAWL